MKDQINKPLSVVWFKRDLRIRDHAPLKAAIDAGKPILLLYIIEPILVDDPHMQARHWRFILQSLEDLKSQITEYNLKLTVCYGDAAEIFENLNRNLHVTTLYSYKEIGLKHTFDRDIKLKDLCKRLEIEWQEFPYGAVIRGLTHRNDWRKHWYKSVKASVDDPNINNARCANTMLKESFLTQYQLTDEQKVRLTSHHNDDPVLFQQGGEKRAWHTLDHFLQERGQNYAVHISSPLLSRRACSRLSPYLAWGNITTRQIYQRIAKQRTEMNWKRALKAFSSRLQWRCHFIQKFESEHLMQFRPTNQAYQHFPYIRDNEGEDLLIAWKKGMTGFPLVDACMRALINTGFINFRMRAMLVSFLTHHLNIDWQRGIVHLGSLFLDYEPGIHYPQFQMQAGVTGTNTIRIYNPIKQAQDNDPKGEFIRQWCPELSSLPDEMLYKPWEMSSLEQAMYEVQLGTHYPLPIIDVDEASREARDRLWGFRKRDDVRAESKRVLEKLSMPDSPRPRF